MKLFSFLYSGPHEHDIKYKTAIIGRRWTISTSLTKESCDISIDQEMKSKNRNDWTHCWGYYDFRFIFSPEEWKIRKQSVYHDGSHNSIQAGPFMFNWIS